MPDAQIEGLNTFMDLLLDAICLVDIEGNFVHVSASCERIFGYTRQEMIGRNMLDLIHPDDRAKTLAAANKVAAGELLTTFENRYIRKDGSTVHINWSARWSEDHKLRIAVARDITERKRSEARQAAVYAISEAAHETDDLPALFERIHAIVAALLPGDQFCIALADERTGEVSLAYHASEADDTNHLLSSDALELCTIVIKGGRALLIPPIVQAGYLPASQSLCVPLRTEKQVAGALLMTNHSSEQPYTDEHKELLQFVSTQIGAAIRRQTLHARMQHMALHDGLTGLPNRGLFHDRVRVWLARVRREQVAFSLLYVDLDNFKEVNDQHGHSAGDALLQQVAKRLQASVRESDTVARFGGDEFVVLVTDVKEPGQISAIADKILDMLSQPYRIAGHEVTVSPSIGVAHCPLHGTDEKLLLRRADQAMYQAKRRGGNQLCINGLP